MIVVLSLVGIRSTRLQLNRGIILKVPVSKFRETHILIEFRIVFTAVLKVESKLLCELFRFFRRYALRRLKGCRLDDLLVFCIITEGYLYSESIASFCNSSHK